MGSSKERPVSWKKIFNVDQITPLLLLSFSLSTFLMFSPNTKIARVNGPVSVVAKVKRIIGRAYYLEKHTDSPRWIELRTGAKLSSASLLHAGAQSKILLELNSKSEIWVQPNTTAKLKFMGLLPAIEVKTGSTLINLFKSDRLFLKNGDLIEARSDSQILIKSVLDKIDDLEVSKGTLAVYNDDKKESVIILKRRSLEELSASVELSRENDINKILRNNQHTYKLNRFHWSHNFDDMIWEFQISNQPDFSKKVYKYQLGRKENWSLYLAKGDWYWRLEGRRKFTENRYYSEPQYFSIDSPLKIRRPASLPLSTSIHELQLSYLKNYGLTRVQWNSSTGIEKSYIRTVCPNKKNNLVFMSGQSHADLSLANYVNCIIQVKEIINSARWSPPRQIKPQHVTQQ
tara:strand:- start:161844 stop:163049 length:1206 start_codon:yes stop_codon:yes gene_type:complete